MVESQVQQKEEPLYSETSTDGSQQEQHMS